MYLAINYTKVAGARCDKQMLTAYERIYLKRKQKKKTVFNRGKWKLSFGYNAKPKKSNQIRQVLF